MMQPGFTSRTSQGHSSTGIGLHCNQFQVIRQ